MNNEKTGTLIKTLRTKKGITQKELAEKINVSNATVSKWENAHGFPDISLLEPLAEALDISIAELINGERNLSISALEESKVIKDIIYLSETQRKRRSKKEQILAGLLILLFLLSGYIGIFYLWRHQNETLSIPQRVFNNSSAFFWTACMDFSCHQSVPFKKKLRPLLQHSQFSQLSLLCGCNLDFSPAH